MNKGLYFQKKNYIVYFFAVFLIILFILICRNYSNPSEKSLSYHNHNTKIRYTMVYNLETETTIFYKCMSRSTWSGVSFAVFGVVINLFKNYKNRYLLIPHFIVYIQIMVCYIYKFDGKKRRVITQY